MGLSKLHFLFRHLFHKGVLHSRISGRAPSTPSNSIQTRFSLRTGFNLTSSAPGTMHGSPYQTHLSPRARLLSPHAPRETHVFTAFSNFRMVSLFSLTWASSLKGSLRIILDLRSSELRVEKATPGLTRKKPVGRERLEALFHLDGVSACINKA